MFFSVLIPVYNAEKYIEETVQSVLSQTDKDFEIVLLDDGSTDNSKQICSELASKYSDKVRFNSQSNTGVLFARRELAKMATGDYLIFVDSDDLLQKNALATIKETIVKENAEVVLYDLEKLSDSGNEKYTLPIEGGVYEEGGRLKVLRLLFLSKYSYSMCQKAIKRECFDFNNDYESFKGMRIAEDVFQSFPIMDNAKIIAYIKEPLYIYRKNSGGATASVKPTDFKWNEMLFDREDEYIGKWDIEPADIQTVAENRLRKMLSFLSFYAKQGGSDSYIRFKAFAKALQTNRHFCNSITKASKKKLQKIYRLDLLLMKIHCYKALYVLHRNL